jgi:ribosomal protein S18 acetylase RimI-like enzyme
MNDFIYRQATANDISFLVETIVEAEKSGTEILSYSTIFGLTEEESRKYISKMFLEDIDGCELSISSFLIAEQNGKIAASVGAWIEGSEGIPSNVLKGNLLNYTLPKKCIELAISLNSLLSESHIEYIPNTIQIGVVYVAPGYRGMNLVSVLIEKQISLLTKKHPTVSEIYVQVFGNNLPAIKAYEKANFKVYLVKDAPNKEISKYLPSNKKVLMKRELTIK